MPDFCGPVRGVLKLFRFSLIAGSSQEILTSTRLQSCMLQVVVTSHFIAITVKTQLDFRPRQELLYGSQSITKMGVTTISFSQTYQVNNNKRMEYNNK